MRHGFLYLVAVMDWFSRYVLSWRLSKTLEGTFCCEAFEEALSITHPEIFNTDQGSQFTAMSWTGRLESCGISVSMDGRGRALDNVFIERLCSSNDCVHRTTVFIERLWRSVKYEEVYLHDYENGWQAEQQLTRYFQFDCHERIHQSLGYQTPASVYFGKVIID